MQALWDALERHSDGSPRRTPHPASLPPEPTAPLQPRNSRRRRRTGPALPDRET
jgi:hypothetical protein